MKNTVVINLIGAPGAGKSTLAAELFGWMKREGYSVELVSEFAKELVWEQREETMKNEIYLFAKQHHRMFRLKGKVDFIITDRPLILSIFYNRKYGDRFEDFDSLVQHEVRKFNNINIFLLRDKPYKEEGRLQTKEESDLFSVGILKVCREFSDNICIIKNNAEALGLLRIMIKEINFA